MPLNFTAMGEGFVIALSLIVAIGAQNAYVLRQGLKREHVLVVVLVSTFGDCVLTAIGVNGLGGFLATSPTLTRVGTFGGGLFLVYFAVKSFRSALEPNQLEINAAKPTPPSKREVALAALGFSFLNPHAILDTVVLLGTYGARFEFAKRQNFLLGAILGSTVWFFALGYGASALAPLFRKPRTWQILDIAIGIIMLVLAFSLFRSLSS
jgi:L-lysine exporter family protein LysE/ArgO